MTAADLTELKFAIPQASQERIVKWFLESDTLPAQNPCTDLRLFFQYYTRQCCQALHDNAQHISAKYHKDIFSIAQKLKDSVPKHSIRQQLVTQHDEPKPDDIENLCESSIHLTARALLMIDIGELQYGFSGRKRILWEQGTVHEFTQKVFPSDPILGHEGVKLGSMFIARNLWRVTGIKIKWTTNLADHLRMTDEDRAVIIFHHASFLYYQRQ